MKLKKIIVLLMAGAMAVAPFSFAACSSSGDSGSTNNGGNTDETKNNETENGNSGNTDENNNGDSDNTDENNNGDSSNSDNNNNGDSDNTENGDSSNTDENNNGDSGDTETTVEYTITYNYNHDGMETTTETVTSGAFAEKPTDPTCTDGHMFLGWYTDEEGKNPYTFKEGVTENITLYASWYSVTAGKCVAVFNTNNANGDVITVEFDSGTYWSNLIKDISDPVWADHTFNGWYKEDGTQYKNLNKIETNITVYAQWLGVYTIEAENTQFDSAAQHNLYSGSATGTEIIQTDKSENLTASNGYYVYGLWKKGETLSFEFYADEADDNVILAFRLSAAYGGDVKTTGDQIFVGIPELDADGNIVTETVEDEYGDSITSTKYEQKYNYELNITASAEMSTTIADFQDYTLSATVKVKKGKNIIQLVINNSQSGGPGATMKAIAPVVDCLKITTTSTISPVLYGSYKG